MVKAIKGRNCELADPLVVCAPIPKAPIEGGYNHDRRQVLVNSLVIKSQSDALTLLLHELTHAYDACRVYVDPGNCRHSACSEVSSSAARAARRPVGQGCCCCGRSGLAPGLSLGAGLRALQSDGAGGDLTLPANSERGCNCGPLTLLPSGRCSQIRASNLSTECSWQNEWFGTRRTPHLGFRAQQQACVKRRAAKSIGMLEACKGKDPRAVVDSVFERCYADTAPFPRTPI